MKPIIILVSHGHMAKEMLESAKMIVGEAENVFVVSMLDEDGLSGTTSKLEQLLKDVPETRDILILADLKGGTPCNVAVMKMGEYPNIRVISGLNLAMLIEAIVSSESDVDALADYLVSVGDMSIEKIIPIDSSNDEEYDEE